MTTNEIQFQIISQQQILSTEQLTALYQTLPQYPDADLCSLLQSYGYLDQAAVNAIRGQVQSYQSSSSGRLPASSSGHFGTVEPSQAASEQSIVRQLHEVLKANPWFQPSAELLWEKLQKLGEGGMGTVYKVRDPRLQRNAALKLLLEEGDELAIKRFLREVKITARLEHPNIPPVYEVGKTTSGQHYMVMKVVEGITLKDRIKRLHRKKNADQAAVDEVLSALVKVGEAVSYAHSQGIVHRDLKPENIMLGRFGEVQVMDWGIAKDLESLDESEEGVVESCDVSSNELASLGVTVTGSMVGTPGYMAPEQIEGEASPEGDVYALGVILTEILTGEKAIAGSTNVERIAATVTGNAKTPRSYDRKIAKDIDALAVAACQLNPKQRLASAELFVENLRAYLGHEALPLYRYSLLQRSLRTISRSPGFFVSMAMLLVLLTSTTTLYQAFRTSERQREAAEDSAKEAEGREDALKEAVRSLYELEQAVQRGMPEAKIIEKLDAALRLGEFDESLLISAAKICRKAGLNDRAKELLVKAIQENKDNEPYEALFILHKIELSESSSATVRMTSAAKEIARIAKEAGVTNEFTVTLDAAKLYMKGDLEAAEKIMGDLEKYSTSFSFGYYVRGLIEQKLFKDEAARESYNNSLKHEPGFTSALLGLAELERKVGRTDEAAQLYALAIEENPKDWRAYSNRSQLRRLRLDYVGAMEDINIAVRLNNKNVGSLLNRAAIKNAINDLEGALTDMELAARKSPDNPIVLGTLGLIYIQTGKVSEARKILDRVQIPTKDIIAYRIRSQLKAGLKDYTGSLSDLDFAIGLDKNNSELFRMRAMVRRLKGELTSAIEDFNQSIQINPKNIVALNTRGVTLMELKQNKKAILDFQAVLKIAPKHPKALENLGTTLKRMKRYREAIQAFSRLLQIDANNVSALRMRATCRQNSKDYRGSLVDLDRVERLAPNDKDLYSNRGVLKVMLKDYQGAIKDMTKAIERNPKNPQLYVNRSTAFKRFKKYPEAIQDLSQSIKMAPGKLAGYLLRAELYELMKKYELALKDFDKVIEFAPNKSGAYLSKGRVLVRLKRNSEAAKVIDRFLKMNPTAPNTDKLRAFVKKHSK
ncbi:MAG: protein kinase [Planctomycetota bacterium]|nr:protein kinase [Planctomycetota bacterium]